MFLHLSVILFAEKGVCFFPACITRHMVNTRSVCILLEYILEELHENENVWSVRANTSETLDPPLYRKTSSKSSMADLHSTIM